MSRAIQPGNRTFRWLGRFALEHPRATLAMLHQAVAAFERLPDDPEAAHRELVALIRS